MWLGILCLMFVLILIILFDYSRPSKFPPGPRGFPIIGNILDIANLLKETKLHGDVWCRLAEKYGPIVGLKLGLNHPVIIVSGRAAVTEMLHRPEFDGRPDGFIFKFRCGGVPQGLLFTDTDVWHSQRRFTLKTLKQFGFGKNMVDSVLRDAISLTNIIIELTKKGTITNLYYLINIAVFINLWFIMEGTKSIVGKESPELKETISIFNDVLRSTNVSGGILNFFPFLRYLFPGLTGFSLFKEQQDRIDKFIRKVISKHKENKIEGEPTNFIDSYLQEIQVQKTKSPFSFFTENQLIYVLKDLIVAGADTTNNTIGFIIAYLAVHQDVQKKMHDEIDKIVSKDSWPSFSDKNRLPYLNAVVTEVLRLSNITPSTIPHRAIKDSNLLGFEIKKNYSLIANLKSVHMDKEYWGDPEVFRPERFIDENGQFIDNSWFIPFGLGRRKCFGETVAKSTVFLFVACLFHKLRFMLPENHPEHSLQGVNGFVVAPPKIDIIAVQRHCP